MKAIQITQHGDYDVLRPVDLPVPQPRGKEALVRMTAAAVNALDDQVRRGMLPIAGPAPLVAGIEGVGVVEEPGDSGLKTGTGVMVWPYSRRFGLTEDGTWAEYVTADSYSMLTVPSGICDMEAAGFLVSYVTAQLALTYAGGFKAGQTVLAPAVGGSIGNAVLQLARAQGAARVLTTAGTTAKAEQARAAGYTDVIDLSEEMLIHTVLEMTDGRGVDLAIDTIGGFLTGSSLAALAPGGTLVTVGYRAGNWVDINLSDLIGKSGHMVGLDLFAVPEEAIRQAVVVVRSLLAERLVRPLVARTFPLLEAATAQRYQMEEHPFGKVILTI
ncbi:MAG TPA: zinc-binding alcohol dehydrogenase family protein [Chthonomonadaceae bacterium]|nr:zinc-binding alcohol dehydrogenase family protein [Chthonomonadaceae bacterium]